MTKRERNTNRKFSVDPRTHQRSSASAQGFTLLEILVVTTVILLLSTVLILYSNTSRQQIAAFVEEVKISQLILRAKSLAITTYNQPVQVPCGYGFYIEYGNPGKYGIAKYDADDCSKVENTPPIWNYRDKSGVGIGSEFTLNPNLLFEGGSNLGDVVFFPPDPITKIFGKDGLPHFGTAKIRLKTLDGSLTKEIKVNPSGQVSF